MPAGTIIDNHAGIFFDDNAAVLTNTVEDIIGSPAGIAVANASQVQVFPNPATNRLTITTANGAYTSYTIMNTVGAEMLHNTLSSSQTMVDIKQLPAGMYYVIVKGEAGSVVKKFVKM